jgi:type II secretory pathway pseudopilin PulG
MVVLGLVLLVAAGVFTAAVITSNTSTTAADLWGAHVSNISLGGVFVAGMVAGVVALLGLVMLFGGMRRSARRNRERRQLARENARLNRRQEAVTDEEVPDNHRTVVEPAPVPTERTTDHTVEHTGRTDYDTGYDGTPDTVREREVVRERMTDDRPVIDRTENEEYVPAGTAEPTVTERMKARAARWRR